MTILAAILLLVAPTAGTTAGDPAMPDLRIGTVTLEREDIFTRAEVDSASGAVGFLKRLSNRLHATTRPHVLRREFLFREGDPYRPDLLAETERNLRGLGFLAEATVAPVDTSADGRVDVHVLTRESWTLESDITFSLDAGGTSRWTAQMADRNFLGYGVTTGAGLGRDLSSDYWNLWYRQRRLAGSELTLGLDYAQRAEGRTRRIDLSRPFYALDDATGIEARAWSSNWRNRFYLSNGGPAGADPARAASLFAEIPFKDVGWQFGLQRRLSGEGAGRVWRLGIGVRVQERRFAPDDRARALSDGRTADLGFLDDDGTPYRRAQGTSAYPHLWLRTVSRRWVTERYLLRYGGLEDIELGWDVDLRFGPAGGMVGATTGDGRQRWRCEALAQRWLPLGPGYALLVGVAEADFGSVAVRTHRWNVVVGWLTRSGSRSTPWLTRLFAEVGAGERLTGARPFLLGSERGLRTLPVDGMAGDRLVRANLELGRATGVQPLGVFRLGVAAFCGVGSAWWADEARSATDLRREAGLGLRFGPVRSASVETARLDLAWSLDGGGPELVAVTGGLF
ncbi:MAG: hypothetical protein IPK64_15575 [bacterium]|nr:hypothetical protein [bacterium]